MPPNDAMEPKRHRPALIDTSGESSAESPLLRLSTELLTAILAALPHAADVAALAASCRRLAALARSRPARRAWLVAQFPALPRLPASDSPLALLSPVSGPAAQPSAILPAACDPLRLPPLPHALNSLLCDAILLPLLQHPPLSSPFSSPPIPSPLSLSPSPSLPHPNYNLIAARRHLLLFCAARGFTDSITFLLTDAKPTVSPHGDDLKHADNNDIDADAALALVAAAAHAQKAAIYTVLHLRPAALVARIPAAVASNALFAALYNHNEISNSSVASLASASAHAPISIADAAIQIHGSAAIPATITAALPTIMESAPAAATALFPLLTSLPVSPSEAVSGSLLALVLARMPDPHCVPLLESILKLMLHQQQSQPPPAALVAFALCAKDPVDRLAAIFTHTNANPERIDFDWSMLSEPDFLSVLAAFWKIRMLSSRDPFLYYDLLEIAVSRGYARAVAAIIDHGVHVTFQNNWLLRLACVHNTVNVARVLLDRGADAQIGSDSLIIEAASMGRLPLLGLLLKYTKSASSFKHALLAAIDMSRVSVVTALLDALKSNTDQQNMPSTEYDQNTCASSPASLIDMKSSTTDIITGLELLGKRSDDTERVKHATLDAALSSRNHIRHTPQHHQTATSSHATPDSDTLVLEAKTTPSIASAIQHKNSIIASALRRALRNGNPQVIFVLLSHGANVCSATGYPQSSMDALVTYWTDKNEKLRHEIASRTSTTSQ